MKKVINIMLAVMLFLCGILTGTEGLAAVTEPDEQWAEECGWSKQNDRYIKWVNGIQYELWCGKNAYDRICGNDYNWQIITGKSESLSGTVEIPGEIDGFPVTAIGGETFRADTKITECILGEGIVLISAGAFENCRNLNAVKLPSSFKMIDTEAFYNCPGLSELVIPGNTEYVAVNAFSSEESEESGLKKVTFEGDAPQVLYGNGSASLALSGAEIYVYANAKGWDAEEWKRFKIHYMDHVVPPTGTPEPTKTPEPEKTPVPTKTPEPAKTPEPTKIPEPTKTPEPTPVPDITTIPQITEIPTPEVTVTETPAPVYPVIKMFDDVSENWYIKDLQLVYDLGIMRGIGDTQKFMPQAKLTRAQAVQVVYQLAGSPEFAKDLSVFENLKDVYKEEWYAKALAWSYQNGIITGDLNAYKFHPNEGITREQLALVLYRYAAYEKRPVGAKPDSGTITDREKISPWARKAVEWSYDTGILKDIGYENAAALNGKANLEPQKTISRAEMTSVVRRYLEWTDSL